MMIELALSLGPDLARAIGVAGIGVLEEQSESWEAVVKNANVEEILGSVVPVKGNPKTFTLRCEYDRRASAMGTSKETESILRSTLSR